MQRFRSARARKSGGRFGPIGALIDPSAQEPDLRGGEARSGGRHHFGAESRHHLNQAAGGAVSGLDDFERDVPAIETKTSHLLLLAVTHITAAGEQRLDVASIDDLRLSGRRRIVGESGY